MAHLGHSLFSRSNHSTYRISSAFFHPEANAIPFPPPDSAARVTGWENSAHVVKVQHHQVVAFG